MKSSKESENLAHLDLGYLFDRGTKYGLTPYWSSDIEDWEQKDRMLKFNALIYSIWQPIIIKMTKDFDSFKEVQAIHACDLAIHASGFRPDRVSYASMEKDRKKSKLMDKINAARYADQ